MKTKAKVRVRVVVGVDVSSLWDAACTVGQVREQGVDEAEGAVRKALSGTGLKVLGVEALEMTVTSEAER